MNECSVPRPIYLICYKFRWYVPQNLAGNLLAHPSLQNLKESPSGIDCFKKVLMLVLKEI